MSNFSYDDFAVLVRKFNPEMLSPESLKSLRIVPLSTAPSMADAIKGTNLTIIEGELNLPKQKNGNAVESNVTVQHDSAGYCRLVGHIEAVKPQEGQGVPVTTAKAFVLYRTVTEASDGTPKKEVIAVASLKEGFAIGDVCYPSFTITTVNNYQSVAFNPNAFATVEDLKSINGLDGLHIAFDTASGDLKLLDKNGNVLDQANLPIKADVIIAEGEEGYKYVKTDVKQDIHAAKAWMPEGFTAWEAVPEAPYEMQHAALVVEKVSSRKFVSNKPEVQLTISTQTVEIPHVEIGGSTYMVDYLPESACSLFRVKGNAGSPVYYSVPISGNKVTITDASTAEPASHDVHTTGVKVDVITFEGTLCVLGETGNSEHQRYQALPTNSGEDKYLYGDIETSGGSSTGRVLGITPDGTNLYTFDENAETPSKIQNISGADVRWLDTKPLTEVPNHTLKYGLEAFVWTVKGDEYKSNDPFFNLLNASLLALGFHEGDDIALGTNLAKLAPAEGVSPLNGVDADEYIHGKDNKATREQEVDEQRKFAKEELVAWNEQHPELTKNQNEGTIIDHTGLDVRHGSITLGCGNLTKAGVYGIQMSGSSASLDFTVSHTTGNVQFDENGHAANLTSSTLLSIEANRYISGAPTCLALLKCSKDTSDGTVSAGLDGGRITANFTAGGAETNGVFTLTITDNRANNGFGEYPRIVEIIPVYKSGADAQEAVPAQRSISAIETAQVVENKSTLSIQCSQVIDWAQSIALGGAENGMALYLIVKVY